MRLPLAWATFIAVRLQDGYLSHMFVSFRTGTVRRALVDLGWDVEDGPRVRGRDVLFSPRPSRDR